MSDTAEPSGADYKSRVRSLRAASQDRLRALRAARRARRGGDAAPVVETDADAPDVLDTDGATCDPAEPADAPIAFVETPEPVAAAAPSPLEPLAVQAQTPIAAGADRSLSRLPGVGPGLIWLFNKAGVHTLDDLAAADAARLRDEIGVLGDMLDLETWIDLAAASARA